MDIIATTCRGKVRGRVRDRIATFLGIPYAAAPFGTHRFRAPAPVEPWEGVRDALEYGPTAPQRPYRPPLDQLIPDMNIPGDECLNLNVWTPDPGGGPLPVMVWIHGGSLRNGSAAMPLYDGEAFARDGVVLVSVNYRLGVEGFGVFPDAPDNRGLLDQIAALTWVRDNIAAFGGDPGNVTVCGESAGAISIAALTTSPRAAGLFHRAVLQSGPPHTVPRSRGAKTVRAMAKALHVPATAQAFAALDRERLLDVQTEVVGKADPISGGPASTSWSTTTSCRRILRCPRPICCWAATGRSTGCGSCRAAPWTASAHSHCGWPCSSSGSPGGWRGCTGPPGRARSRGDPR